jgi:hypothetical protein
MTKVVIEASKGFPDRYKPDKYAELHIQRQVCRIAYSETSMQNCIFRNKYAELHTQGKICRIAYSGENMQNCILRGKYAELHTQGKICRIAYSEVQLLG